MLSAAISLILAQIGICFAGSRCTKIETPCLSMTRKLPGEDEERPRRNSDEERPRRNSTDSQMSQVMQAREEIAPGVVTREDVEKMLSRFN